MTLLALPLIHQLSYAGLFLLLFGGAIVVPIPEEITLLTAGYLVAIGDINAVIGVPVAVAGLLAGDCLLFFLARIGAAYAHKLRERVNKIGLDGTWLFSSSQPLRAVFLLRFLTGFRFVAPIYAGFEEVSWKGYLLTDIISVIIFVPLMFWLGYAFHASIIAFIAGFEVVRHALFILILAAAGTGLLAEWYLKWRK
ncbi:MAG: VTT domain-containing protein [Candidatus Pacebacteria bacterium]|nr:VTT domain-containing protein [Candidatus Paceibacterota bacterium]